MGQYRIAVVPGDGIGKEVIPQAVRVINAAQAIVSGLNISFHEIEAGGEYYLKTGQEWSREAEDFVKKKADAVLFGAVGTIDGHGDVVRLSDGNLAGYHVVIGLRFDLDLYANVRPVRLMEGVPTPLANKTHKDIDMLILRENTEGLYTPARGTLVRGGEPEIAIDTRVITHKGSARVIERAFRIAERRNGRPADGTKMVTCVDKSNLLAGCQLFRYTFDQIANRHPDITRDYAYVDAWTQWCIRKPENFDVVVAPNAFGDIITDLGAAIQGGLGMAPAGSVGDTKGVFEPVHGSAPKHYGENSANPIASILAGSMMLDWLADQHKDEHSRRASQLIEDAVTQVLREGKVRTYDLCIAAWRGITPSSTVQVTDEIIRAIKTRGREG